LSTQRRRKLSSTSAAIAELSFGLFAFLEKKQPLAEARRIALRDTRRAFFMLKTSLTVVTTP
jgi:hypothetical protein